MRQFIKRWLIKRSISKTASRKAQKTQDVYDEVLQEEIRRLADVNRTADKILKAKLIRQQSEATLNKIRELDDELEDDYEEAPQETMGLEDQIGAAIVQKLLGGAASGATPQQLEQQAQAAGVPQEKIDAFKAKILGGENNV